MRHERGGSRVLLVRAQDRENVIRHAFAARAGEGEDAGQGESDLTFEIGAQHEPRAMQPGLYSLGPQIEKFGRFLDAHLLDQAGDQDDATRRPAP